MACYPWILLYAKQHVNIEEFPHLKRWLQQIQMRSAVKQAYEKAKIIDSFVTNSVYMTDTDSKDSTTPWFGQTIDQSEKKN